MVAPLKTIKQTEHRTSMNLTQEMYEHVREMADDKGISIAGIMRMLIKAEIQRNSHARSKKEPGFGYPVPPRKDFTMIHKKLQTKRRLKISHDYI